MRRFVDCTKDDEVIADLRCEVDRLITENMKLRQYLSEYGVTEETLDYWLYHMDGNEPMED